MARLKLSPPWVLYYKKLSALFDEDKTIRIIFDEDNMEIKIYTYLERKSKALSFLLPNNVSFGDVDLKITVVPVNMEDDNPTLNTAIKKFNTEDITTCQAAIKILFEPDTVIGNQHVKNIKRVLNPYGEFLYVIFKKEVIQYYEDNLSDFYGNCSTLCEDIAKEIFKDIEGVFFCTSIN